MRPPIAVLVPCRNEAITIARVVSDFRAALPDAEIWVCDNASTDDTAARARAAGASVLAEPRPGKGHALRRLLGAVDADVYVMVDGDATYDAASAPRLVAALVEARLDMVVGRRVTAAELAAGAYRRGHQWGNRLFTASVSRLFGVPLADVFSGYRVMSRRFVRSLPALSRGFELETELTVHAADLGLSVRELDTPYGARPQGSASKLSTWSDGARILAALTHFYEQMHPVRFFGVLGITALVLALVLGVPVIVEFVETHQVPRFPTAVLAAALVVIAALMFVCGIILDSVSRGRREAKRLAYLAA
ncbi:MAG: glycosyltransferase [Proteobacteria bacterium]|nr:glycosyltransferase [Pseudomonadota bacterium]